MNKEVEYIPCYRDKLPSLEEFLDGLFETGKVYQDIDGDGAFHFHDKEEEDYLQFVRNMIHVQDEENSCPLCGFYSAARTWINNELCVEQQGIIYPEDSIVQDQFMMDLFKVMNKYKRSK